jgi:hypothetical protein
VSANLRRDKGLLQDNHTPPRKSTTRREGAL